MIGVEVLSDWCCGDGDVVTKALIKPSSRDFAASVEETNCNGRRAIIPTPSVHTYCTSLLKLHARIRLRSYKHNRIYKILNQDVSFPNLFRKSSLIHIEPS